MRRASGKKIFPISYTWSCGFKKCLTALFPSVYFFKTIYRFNIISCNSLHSSLENTPQRPTTKDAPNLHWASTYSILYSFVFPLHNIICTNTQTCFQGATHSSLSHLSAVSYWTFRLIT